MPPAAVLTRAWVETWYQTPMVLAEYAASLGRPVWGFKYPGLTRDEITPAVHFLKFHFTPAQIEQFRTGPVRLAIDHSQYAHAIELSDDQRAQLAADFASG